MEKMKKKMEKLKEKMATRVWAQDMGEGGMMLQPFPHGPIGDNQMHLNINNI